MGNVVLRRSQRERHREQAGGGAFGVFYSDVAMSQVCKVAGCRCLVQQGG